MMSLVDWYYSSTKQRAEYDARHFANQIRLPFAIGDIVTTTHVSMTRGLASEVEVLIVDLNYYGFVMTADFGHQRVWDRPDYGCQSYSLSCIKKLIHKNETPIEDLLTDSCKAHRMIGSNLLKYNAFVERFLKTKPSLRWRLFVPKQKTQQEIEETCRPISQK